MRNTRVGLPTITSQRSCCAISSDPTESQLTDAFEVSLDQLVHCLPRSLQSSRDCSDFITLRISNSFEQGYEKEGID